MAGGLRNAKSVTKVPAAVGTKAACELSHCMALTRLKRQLLL